MNEKLVFKNVVVIFMLLFFSILYRENAFVFLLNLVFIIFLVLATFRKKITLFLLFSLILFIQSFLLLDYVNIWLILIYYFFLVISLIDNFKYAFDLINNSMNLTFKSLSFPKRSKFLVVKYLNGPVQCFNSNAIISKCDDYFLIQIEDVNGCVSEVKLFFNNIKSVNVNVKPYIKTGKGLNNYSVDYMKSFSVGKVTGEFDSYRKSKVVKSYEINIILDKDVYTFLSFDNPIILKQ